MNTEAEIEKELNLLITESANLLKLTKNVNNVTSFGNHYQSWYSRALKLVDLLGSDRLDEFINYYLIDPKRKRVISRTYIIQDYLRNDFSNEWGLLSFDIHKTVYNRLQNQIQILKSLNSRLSNVLSDVRGHLLSQIEDEELKVAERLISASLRGAGAIAGVVLEGHLQRVAANHKIVIKKKPSTISDLNDPLKASGIYDLPTFRKIQLLGDIRNYCDHKKEREPTKSEVDE